MDQRDPIARILPKRPSSISEWETAIATTIATEDMLPWFEELLQALGQETVPPFEARQILCAAQCRFRDLAHFSRKLSDEQRRIYIAQADTIVGLVRDIWKTDLRFLEALDKALASEADRHQRFGWPSPVADVLEFSEL